MARVRAPLAAAALGLAAWALWTLARNGVEPFGAYADEYKAFFTDTVLGFVDHVRARHADDPRGRNLLESFQGKFEWDTNGTGLASYSRKTGVVRLNLRDYADQPLTEATRAYIRSQVLHEMAHSTPDRHDRNWQDAYVFFLGIATEELGWTVLFKGCTRCANYGMCSRSMCPKCLWEYEPDSCPQPAVPGSWNQMHCNKRGCVHNGTTAPKPVFVGRPRPGDPLPE